MAYFPQNATGLNYATYPAGPTPLGVTVTAHASANTKGSYAEITASTGFACVRAKIVVQFTATGALGRTYLMDIATGGAGAETVVVPNIPLEEVAGSSFLGAAVIDLPLAIASGTRVAARVQCSTGGETVTVALSIQAAGGAPGITSWTTYGAATSTSRGTSIDPGGSTNTKGSYTEITSSTSGVIQSLALMTTFGNNSAMTGARYYIDIATGGAGSETVLIADIPVMAITTAANAAVSRYPRCSEFLTYIPAGTRVAIRASCSINDATDRLFDAVLLTGTAPSESSGILASAHVFGS